MMVIVPVPPQLPQPLPLQSPQVFVIVFIVSHFEMQHWKTNDKESAEGDLAIAQLWHKSRAVKCENCSHLVC